AVGQAARSADQPDEHEARGSVPERMLDGLKASTVPVAFFLSGRDYVAREFEQCVAGDKGWAEFVESERCSLRHFVNADHTFSSAQLRDSVSSATLEWVRSISEH